MRRFVVAITVVAGVVTSISSVAEAIPVSSVFNSGLDGWTITSGSIGGITWQPAGGNPGGYVRYQDGPGVGSRIIAPSKFLGDWSSLDGVGVISYDHMILIVGTGAVFHPYGIEISGPGGSADWHGATPSGMIDWPTPPDHTVVAHLREGDWSILSGSWFALLADVTELRILIEGAENVYVPGMPWTGDTTGFDNVYLGPCSIPAPSALLLGTLGTGLIGWLRRCRAR